MSTFGLEAEVLRQAGLRWRELGELMDRTSQDLSAAPVTGVAAEVRHAATAFLTAWSGFAEESAEIAEGFATALAATADGALLTDRAVGETLQGLDARIGPQR